ncbi:hypothetical protein [Moorena producens]|uniref:hypothetical protein n=1 Tax=Moorena producens TaxID=1155739 RepID=UPI003C75BCC7
MGKEAELIDLLGLHFKTDSKDMQLNNTPPADSSDGGGKGFCPYKGYAINLHIPN